MHYQLIRAHKKTLSLQVTSTGQVIARAPYLMPKFLIDRFIKQKESWIAKRQAEIAKPKHPKTRYFTIPQLKHYIAQQLTLYGKKMGLKHTGLRFTNVKSYWGTCAPSGLLSFNLALRYTPKEVVSYVVVHELAHLQWKGHGKRFWSMVEKYYPKTKEARLILRHTPRYL